MQITKQLDSLNNRIALAATAAGRSETEVSVLAVSKRHSVDAIRAAVKAGLTHMGENYLQEALEKIALLSEPVEWHYIGKIQSNKTRPIAQNFHWVQTVDNEKVARRLSEQRPAELPALNICVQINADSSQHGGVNPDQALALCEYISTLPQLRLRGLMTIPLPTDSDGEQRKPFRLVHELYSNLINKGFNLDTLSMGMSSDLEAAIAEGSTMLRIGTALFGPRPG
jgi:pyridoxal phosphate enzyme (YggS family)